MILNLQGVPTDGEFKDNLTPLCPTGNYKAKQIYPLYWTTSQILFYFLKLSFYDFPLLLKSLSLQYIINILLTVSTGNLV